MRLAVAVVIGLIAAATPSSLSAQQLDCRGVAAEAASFLKECGDRLYSFTLRLSESKLGLPGIKREIMSRYHGGFYVSCPVEPMCENEPAIGGWFIQPANWSSGPKDAQAIYQVMRSIPLGFSDGTPPMPSLACPVFDVSIGGMAGRGVCFIENAKSDDGFVVIVAADERVGFMLSFSQRGKPAIVLKDKVLELLPRFEIDRATGDLGLKKWLK
jgi:hypothetical protein